MIATIILSLAALGIIGWDASTPENDCNPQALETPCALHREGKPGMVLLYYKPAVDSEIPE